MGLGRNHYRGLPEPLFSSAIKNIQAIHIYANGTSGSDSNEGYSPDDAKGTLDGVFGLLTDVITEVAVIHLAGTFNLTSNTYLSAVSKLTGGASIVILGEDEKTDILAATTSTSSTTTSITKTGAGWTTDEYAGYFVEILDGPQAGFLKMIQSNTSDTLHFTHAASSSPGTPSFRVCHYSTTINVPSGFKTLSFALMGINLTLLSIARLNFTSSGIFNFSTHCQSQVLIDACTFGSGVRINTYFGATVRIGRYHYINELTTVFPGPGVGFRDSTYIALQRTGHTEIGQSFVDVGSITLERCEPVILYGTRLKNSSLVVKNCGTAYPTYGLLFQKHTASGAQSPRVDDNTGVGVYIEDSVAEVKEVIIENCASHAMEVVKGHTKISSSDVAGTGNTGAGLYAHSNAVIRTTSGSAPTITGAVGQVSLDGSTQASTWSSIDSGTPIDGSFANNDDFVIVKKS